jgi:hypothetical protein
MPALPAAAEPGGRRHRLERGAAEQIEARGHAERRGLQIVDAVATGYWYALNRNRFGHTEDRYARILHPLAYRRNGRCRSYGLKFFPPEVELLMRNDPNHAWVRDLRI